jgi:hypothetical protein
MGLSFTHHAGSDSKKYDDCLPKEVRLDQVVSYGRKPEDNITVAKKLFELKAHCNKQRLVDKNNREIRFFRASCWGMPPPNYLEIKEKEKAEFEKLTKEYTVITMSCNPRTM